MTNSKIIVAIFSDFDTPELHHQIEKTIEKQVHLAKGILSRK